MLSALYSVKLCLRVTVQEHPGSAHMVMSSTLLLHPVPLLLSSCYASLKSHKHVVQRIIQLQK
jgi:hypothetical protein